MSSVQAASPCARAPPNHSGRVRASRRLPPNTQRYGARQTARCACSSSDEPQAAGAISSAPLPPLAARALQQEPPPQQQQEQDQIVARRGILTLMAATAASTSSFAAPVLGAAAAEAAAPAAPPAAPAAPVVVPPLTETYYSSEGFAFNYPQGWVVAFDRSGSSGNGAVVVVGDFRQLITVSVFRTETIPQGLLDAGLSQEAGYSICVQPQQAQSSTMRFQLLRSELVPPAPGSSPPPPPPQGVEGGGGGGGAGAGGAAYEFEFSIESCAGEIEEGLGGKLRCLSFGAPIPSQRRRHIGRCVLANGRAYSLNASSPEDRWAQVGPVVQAVVSTFRS